MNWRYLFYEVNGDGTENFIRGDVPVVGGQPTRKLSSPHQISGSIKAGTAGELHAPDGSTVLRRWKTSVYVADDNDKIWVGGLLADYTVDGDMLNFDVAGFTAYPKDLPYDGEYNAVQEDPLDLTRQLWVHVQSQPGGNLGLVLDSTVSPVRIGVAARDVNFSQTDGTDVSFTAYDGAVALNWWSTADIAGQIDTWAKSTPFDYLEDHTFLGDVIQHNLRLGYPTIGARRPDPRFVLGENVKVLPGEDYTGDDVVTEVWVFGAGEGRARVRGVASVSPRDSLRRVRIIDDKSLTNFADAQQRASDILSSFQPEVPGAGVTQLVVDNHSNAEFGSFDVGDEVIYSGEHRWGDVVIWVKIISMTLLPSGKLQLGVVRADTIAS